MTLFDIGLYLFSFLSPIFFLFPWGLNMIQGIFFVFGIFALLGLAFLSPRQRECKDNRLIGLLILWSLLNVFIHTFDYWLGKSSRGGFINFCLMSEGFIYVLCGCLLYYLVLSYTKKFNIFYPILAINILNLVIVVLQSLGYRPIWSNISAPCGMLGTKSQLALFSAFSIPIIAKYRFNERGKIWFPLILIPLTCMVLSFSYTSWFAFFIAVAIYLGFVNRQRMWLWLSAMVFIIVSLTGIHKALWDKLLIRMDSLVYTCKEIITHPFVGWGFDNSLAFNMIYNARERGMVYRHNDFLNFTRDLGLVVLVLMVLFFIKFFKRTKIDYLFASVLILLIGCAFQTNAYFPRIAGIGIVLLGLKGIEKC